MQNAKLLHEELHQVRGAICYLKLPQLEKTLKKFHDVVKIEPHNSNQMQEAYSALQKAMDVFWEVLKERGVEELTH